MLKALENAIEKVKDLPPERQAYAAEILEQITAATSEALQVPDDHRAAVLEGLVQAERDKFAVDDEVDVVLRKPWLRER